MPKCKALNSVSFPYFTDINVTLCKLCGWKTYWEHIRVRSISNKEYRVYEEVVNIPKIDWCSRSAEFVLLNWYTRIFILIL